MRGLLLVVQCRYASRRLFGKALYPFAGMPLVVFLLRRMQRALPGVQLVLATTQRSEDDILARWADEVGTPCVRGCEDDVLARYCQCLDAFPAEYVVRITGDNPLTEPDAIRPLAKAAATGRWNYLSSLGAFPRGVGVDAFEADMLRAMHRDAQTPHAREHLNVWPLEHLEPAHIFHLPPVAESLPDIDCSIDTHEDWLRVSGLVANHPDPLGWNIRRAYPGTRPTPLS
ncbi:MAG: NTP transferase domain-containing protein [Desulfovibrionaceae bacterium]